MLKRVHILGICGTFMGGVALLARELGYEVEGSDSNIYPPMSTMLEQAGIRIHEGYLPANLCPAPDLVVIGNALSRGNPAVEYVLDQQIPYISGPQWLGENLLEGRWVAAVSGTHGKTSTSSMLAWILECSGRDPGFLIGGVPFGFDGSARLGSGPFVVEADEYDSAFFDKRSKFAHYKPKTLVINNLEFDHADIFDDLKAIQTQFHHLIRCVPARGKVLCGSGRAIDQVLNRGCWTPVERLGGSAGAVWQFSALSVSHRELEIKSPGGAFVYDDFAHHPTAIEATLCGVRQTVGSARVIAVVEVRSNTMKDGIHKSTLIPATSDADEVFWFEPPGLAWSVLDESTDTAKHQVFHHVSDLHEALVQRVKSGDHIVIMSNGSFSGLHRQLLQSLA